MPSTAILLATCNGASYIEEMLDSLEAQTDRDWICYIHDDGSDDGTMQIVRAWITAHTSPSEIVQNEASKEDGQLFSDVNSQTSRYRILNGPPAGGAKENFFYILSRVEADYYMFADQDDVWLADKVAMTRRRMRSLERNGRPAAVFTDMYVTDAELHILSDSFIRYIGRDPGRIRYQQILIDNPAAGCTMMINRKLRDLALSPFTFSDSQEDNLKKQLSDVMMHDAWCMEIGAIYGDVAAVDRPLVYYRQHGTNEMGASEESRTDKICRNIQDLLSGRFVSEKHSFHEKIKRMASVLLMLPAMPQEPRKTLTELVQIGVHSKLYRMFFYQRNHFDRAHHSLWMWLWV